MFLMLSTSPTPTRTLHNDVDITPTTAKSKNGMMPVAPKQELYGHRSKNCTGAGGDCVPKTKNARPSSNAIDAEQSRGSRLGCVSNVW